MWLENFSLIKSEVHGEDFSRSGTSSDTGYITSDAYPIWSNLN